MQVLAFDNVRPCRMTLAEMLAGTVAVRGLGDSEAELPDVLRGLPVAAEDAGLPPAA